MNISTIQTIAKRSWGQIQENIAKYRKSLTRHWRRYGTVVAKISILVVFSGAMLFGARSITGADSKQPISTLASVQRYGSTNVDEIAAAEVAAAIARDTKLVVADSITNLSDSLAVQVQLAGTNTEPYLGNPSLIATDTKTRQDILTYTVKSGDTISSIAGQFGVTSDTIRWANGLIGNFAATGLKLTILPISGVRHKVTTSDTATGLASKYEAVASSIVSFNDAEVDGLPVGEWIIVPGGKKAAVTSYLSYSLSYSGNGYFYGYCTYWVAKRRAEIGNPLPRNLGNAVTWKDRGLAFGMKVGTTPRVGAVAWYRKSRFIAGGDGHVGIVEKVNADGTFWTSDMNARGYEKMDLSSQNGVGGWGKVAYRYFTNASVLMFIY